MLNVPQNIPDQTQRKSIIYKVYSNKSRKPENTSHLLIEKKNPQIHLEGQDYSEVASTIQTHRTKVSMQRTCKAAVNVHSKIS